MGKVGFSSEGADGPALMPIDRESLKKKFDLRLRQLLTCLSQIQPSTMPHALLDHLKILVHEPTLRDLTLLEQNRLGVSSLTGDVE